MNSEFRNLALSLENSKREIRVTEDSARITALCTAWTCRCSGSDDRKELNREIGDEDVSFVQLIKNLEVIMN
jgi:hypothetical protein